MESPWFKWYPAAYRAATMHLTAEQDGIYRRLIDHYMETRKPLPKSEIALARIAGVDFPTFCLAFATLLPFFWEDDAGMMHLNRCDEVLAEQDSLSEKRRASGKKGATERHGKSAYSGNSQASARQTISREEERRGEKKEEELCGRDVPIEEETLKYAFSGLVIKLNQADLEAWSRTYSAIPDLTAELRTLDHWAAQKGVTDWFVRVSGALNRKHQEILAGKKPAGGKAGNGGSMRALRQAHQNRGAE